MLRALMASASGCITLSLALHATLLWGVSGHVRSVERHVAIDRVTDAIALDVEGEGERLGDERSSSAPGADESSTDAETEDPVPAARPRPAPTARPVRRAEAPTPPKHAMERAVEKTTAPEPTETSAAPTVVASPSLATAPTPSDASGAGIVAPGVVAPGVLAALPGGANATGSGRASGGGGDGVGSIRGDGSDAAARRVALLDYARRVRARIAEQREYPYAARRARLQGTVCLRLELAASGRLLEAEPTCGSSLGPLAKAALAAVAKASPFPPLPAALGAGLTLDVPVIFELED